MSNEIEATASVDETVKADGQMNFFGVAPGAPKPNYIDLEGLREKLLAPREIIRDREGWLVHPDLPICDEDVSVKKFLDAFGIECAFVDMESDDPEGSERYFEAGEPDCSYWTPSTPEGDGWILLEIFDTEDGPHAVFARRQEQKPVRNRRYCRLAAVADSNASRPTLNWLISRLAELRAEAANRNRRVFVDDPDQGRVVVTTTLFGDDDLEERSADETEEPTLILRDRTGLHPQIAALVVAFAYAIAHKLADAQAKHGWNTNWMRGDWADECREQLERHVAKGDPRDVAAYCAFLWHHGESTAADLIAVDAALIDSTTGDAA